MKKEIIVLGGGCFWCLEPVFSKLKGVSKTVVGYAGGHKESPTYEEVFSGKTGHAETVKVEYDSEKISLENILDVFFHVHDPTTPNRQGNDIGEQYRSIILYSEEKQKKRIKDFISSIQKKFLKPIVTKVEAKNKFFPAEEYHQEYYKKNSEKAYCRLVITPKMAEFQQRYKKLLKQEI